MIYLPNTVCKTEFSESSFAPQVNATAMLAGIVGLRRVEQDGFLVSPGVRACARFPVSWAILICLLALFSSPSIREHYLLRG
jgi:hypothetical protein